MIYRHFRFFHIYIYIYIERERERERERKKEKCDSMEKIEKQSNRKVMNLLRRKFNVKTFRF